MVEKFRSEKTESNDQGWKGPARGESFEMDSKKKRPGNRRRLRGKWVCGSASVTSGEEDLTFRSMKTVTDELMGEPAGWVDKKKCRERKRKEQLGKEVGEEQRGYLPTATLTTTVIRKKNGASK